MRPFEIPKEDQQKREMQCGPVNARQQLLMDKIQSALDLLGADAGVIEEVKVPVKDQTGRPIQGEFITTVARHPNRPELGHEAGQPKYKAVELSERELLLYQCVSTLLQLLREAWTYEPIR